MVAVCLYDHRNKTFGIGRLKMEYTLGVQLLVLDLQ